MLRKNKKEASLVLRFTRFGRIVVISARGVKSSFTEVWIHSRLRNHQYMAASQDHIISIED
jgi:hypothetical protein